MRKIDYRKGKVVDCESNGSKVAPFTREVSYQTLGSKRASWVFIAIGLAFYTLEV